jgi:pimeloyl-ACP methyl ester carboxylesterase
MDLRGHGRSSAPPPDKPLTADRLLDDVEELMALLGVGSAHLTANSAGGYVAQNLTLRSPDRVKSLAVVDSTPGLSPSALSSLPRLTKEGLTPFLADTIAMRFDLETTNPGMEDWFLRQTAANDQDFVVRSIGYTAALNWSGELHRIRCPTLVILPVGDGGQRPRLRQHARAHPRRADDRVPAHAAQHR